MISRPTYSDAAIATKAEALLLLTFWDMVGSGHQKLELLLAFTRLKVLRPEDWDPEAIRAAHRVNQGAAATIQVDKPHCFSCGARTQLYAHHVIEVQHGGSNNIRNQVPLCFDCHQYLHPWLTEEDRAPQPRPKGFESLGSIFVRGGADVVGDGHS